MLPGVSGGWWRVPCCYRYLKWLGIALSLSLFLFLRLLVLFHFGSMPLKRALMLFPSKRFLPQSHACSTLPFRYTRMTYVMYLFILVVVARVIFIFNLHLDLSETSV